ncbi:polysaccharide biosynthesis protein GumN [Neorhizobium sp. SOG26]|uniref:TraB/GumN family protein n=1 Tax=Neorhizobium sp. SOG26 TaxID=2060726 RepID=UPI000E5697A8|nr:TraB/GumN family protein [Neorhizobium sp. SOG26]AXV17425.1 polysaccharide biosynthesis protein GumN [Neorhizobium sp. SOG26]
MTPAPSSLSGALLLRAQDMTLWLLAALHLLALASLLLILGFADGARAQTPACSGENVLEALKTENREAYDKVMAEGEAVPNGKGIFWKVEKPGLEPSYVLGTMHVADPRVLEMPAGARDALARAKTIVVESDEVLDESKAMAALLMKPELTMFTDGRSIETLVPPQDLQLLKDGLKAKGITLSAVSRMKPWMLMSMVAIPACELARKGGGNLFLDKKIAKEAAAEGKQVKGLETLEEQANAINAIPLELHIKSLVEALKLGSKMDDVFFTMTEVYLSGNIGIIQPMLKVVAPDGTEDQAGYAEFDELVITKRNQLMAERAAPIFAEGSAFVAVGAAHLPGDQGLIELLRRQGFTVTAVN